MSSRVSSVDFTDDLPDPEDEEFLVPGVEVGVGEAMRHSGQMSFQKIGQL